MPITITGTGKCFNKSKNFSKLHSDLRYSGENKPPGEKSKKFINPIININANKKFGIANPINPRKVKK